MCLLIYPYVRAHAFVCICLCMCVLQLCVMLHLLIFCIYRIDGVPYVRHRYIYFVVFTLHMLSIHVLVSTSVGSWCNFTQGKLCRCKVLKDRETSTTGGGGVFQIFKADLITTHLTNLIINIESIWTETEIKGMKPIVICTFYHDSQGTQIEELDLSLSIYRN